MSNFSWGKNTGAREQKNKFQSGAHQRCFIDMSEFSLKCWSFLWALQPPASHILTNHLAIDLWLVVCRWSATRASGKPARLGSGLEDVSNKCHLHCENSSIFGVGLGLCSGWGWGWGSGLGSGWGRGWTYSTTGRHRENNVKTGEGGGHPRPWLNQKG